MRSIPALALALPLAVAAGMAGARAALAQEVVRIEERQLRAGAGVITFKEVPQFTHNPEYPPSRYGGAADGLTLRFGGFFQGRRLGTGPECPAGAVATACLAGTPTAPLALDPRAPQTQTVPYPPNDGYHLDPPGLVGSPPAAGPVAVWFDRDVAAAGLHAMGLDGVGTVAISAYDRQGRLLGRVASQKKGFDFLGVATADRTPRIAGFEFHVIGAEGAGFGVDNVRFAAPALVDLPGVVPPATPRPPPAPAAPPAPTARRAPILP